jgi:hypothetical protein
MSGYARVREVERQLGRIMVVGLGVIVLGVLIIAAAWWLPKSTLT